jgi:hypothetical protein
MTKSVSRVIVPAGGMLQTADGNGRPINARMRHTLSGMRIPDVKYRVTYTLNSQGALKIVNGMIKRRDDQNGENAFSCCWVENWHSGRRVSREVKVIKIKG